MVPNRNVTSAPVRGRIHEEMGMETLLMFVVGAGCGVLVLLLLLVIIYGEDW